MPKTIRFIALIAGIVLLLKVSLQAQVPDLPPNTANTPVFVVKSRLVMVPAVVRDKNGVLLDNLTRENFELRVDGKVKKYRYFDHDTNAPLTIGLLVDTSMSQGGVLKEEKTASAAFLTNMLKADDKSFVVQLDYRLLLLTDVTGDKSAVEKSLRHLDLPQPILPSTPVPPDPNMADSKRLRDAEKQYRKDKEEYAEKRREAYQAIFGTKLYDAVYISSLAVTKGQKGTRALIALTDGEDHGSKYSMEQAIAAAQHADTVIYGIYYTSSKKAPQKPINYSNANLGQYGSDILGLPGKKILQRMCFQTGGKVFEVKEDQSVEDIYAKIAEEIREQYRLGFTPEVDAAPGFHSLSVALKGPETKGGMLQSRDGFYIVPND